MKIWFLVRLRLDSTMNNFLNNLNNREKNLILGALLMVITLILFIISSNTIQSLNLSSKKLDKIGRAHV